MNPNKLSYNWRYFCAQCCFFIWLLKATVLLVLICLHHFVLFFLCVFHGSFNQSYVYIGLKVLASQLMKIKYVPWHAKYAVCYLSYQVFSSLFLASLIIKSVTSQLCWYFKIYVRNYWLKDLYCMKCLAPTIYWNPCWSLWQLKFVEVLTMNTWIPFP